MPRICKKETDVNFKCNFTRAEYMVKNIEYSSTILNKNWKFVNIRKCKVMTATKNKCVIQHMKFGYNLNSQTSIIKNKLRLSGGF